MLVEDNPKHEEREGKKGEQKAKRKRKGPLVIKVRAFFSMVFCSFPFFHIINSRVYVMIGFNF
jgi:hypothetical protein